MAEVVTSTSPDLSAGQKCVTESADGAIGIKSGTVMVTKGTAAALTLALPTAGADDGKLLSVISTTAAAHTVTTPASGINGTLHIATFAANVGSSVQLRAYNGGWYMETDIGCTLS